MFIQGLKRTWRDTWHAPDQVDIVALPLSIHTMCSDVTSSKQEPRAKGYGGLIPLWGKVGYGMLWCNTPVTIESPKIPKASGKLPENFPLRIGVGAVQVQEFGPVMYCFAFQGPPLSSIPPRPTSRAAFATRQHAVCFPLETMKKDASWTSAIELLLGQRWAS